MRSEIYDYLAASHAITDLVPADSIYWDFTIANPPKPYLLITVVSAQPDNTLGTGANSSSGYRETVLQIDCIASTAGQEANVATRLADAVEACLNGAVIGRMAATVLSATPIEVTEWDGAGIPPVQGVSLEVRVESD